MSQQKNQLWGFLKFCAEPPERMCLCPLDLSVKSWTYNQTQAVLKKKRSQIHSQPLSLIMWANSIINFPSLYFWLLSKACSWGFKTKQSIIYRGFTNGVHLLTPFFFSCFQNKTFQWVFTCTLPKLMLLQQRLSKQVMFAGNHCFIFFWIVGC